MKRKIITINREYGSGGRKIGERVAKRLGIPFYDGNLIARVAAETGLSKAHVASWDEQVASPRMWGLPRIGAMGNPLVDGHNDVQEAAMVAALNHIIKDIAKQGSAVIMGRGSDYILRDDPDQISVYVFADEAVRVERIWREYGAEDAKAALARLRMVDRGRAAYMRRFVDRAWGDMKNYHLCLDSGKLGIARCIDLIWEAVAD